jgi:hypothetical protein
MATVVASQMQNYENQMSSMRSRVANETYSRAEDYGAAEGTFSFSGVTIGTAAFLPFTGVAVFGA